MLPALWLGLIVGISLIEAPLKFTAPGITIPLGLGIGRRVFFAMNMVEIALAAVLVLSLVKALGRPRGITAGPGRLWLAGLAATALLAIKVIAIRPFLNRRTDMVLAGIDGEIERTEHRLLVAGERQAMGGQHRGRGRIGHRRAL